MALGLVDGSLVLTFAALVGADGFVRVPEGAVTFGRIVGSGWRTAPPASRIQWRLASPWSPVCTVLVASWAPATPVKTDVFVERLALVRTRHLALLVLGALHLLAFILGLPAAVAYYGGAGLIAAVLAVTALGIAIAIVASSAMRALGPGVGDGFGSRLGRALSPFTAPTAAQDVMQAALRDVPAPVVAHVLLEPDAYARWLRPYAWDHLNRAPDAALAAALGKKAIERAGTGVPARRDEIALGYCDRCAGEFAAATGRCPSCDLPVQAFPTHAN